MEIPKPLGDRMKEYEEQTLHEMIIPKDKSYIIRLDGNCFSKFTKGLQQPFDVSFSSAMVNTMNDLLKKYNAVLGYTHSDEISLVFNRCKENQEHTHGGRIVKLVSLMASYCSVKFNIHINEEITKMVSYIDTQNSYGYGLTKYSTKTLEKIRKSEAIFDARVIIFPEDTEIINYFIWRSVYDCSRNCISTHARYQFGHKKIENKNCSEMIEMLKESGFPVCCIPIKQRYGVYAKKVLVEHTGIDPMKQIEVKTMRHEIVNKCFKLEYDINLLETVFLSKYWKDDCEYEPFN
jgi:tRNA(His) guanylyltransferase